MANSMEPITLLMVMKGLPVTLHGKLGMATLIGCQKTVGIPILMDGRK